MTDSLCVAAHATSSGASWPEWLTAIGTVAAVAVALFAETFWRWWRRPVLKLHSRKDDAGCFYKTKAWLPARSTESEAYYLRLWVENEGRGPAEAVQVYASALSQKDIIRGEFKPVREFLPMRLMWTHSNPPSATLPRLHPGIGHHCELANVLERDKPHSLALLVEAAPNTGWHRLKHGTYRLTLRLACANASPCTQTVELFFGGWYDDEADMFRIGVTCKVLGEEDAS